MPADAGADAAAAARAWLLDPVIQEARRGEVLERELENWKGSWVSTYIDDRRQAVGVVFHTDFSDYDAIVAKLEPVMAPLKVVLRPACYSRQQIDEARRVIESGEWHPRGKGPMASYFDAEFSRFAVTIDESAPEVADALRQRLGKLVSVTLGQVGKRTIGTRTPLPTRSKPTKEKPP